MNGTWIISNLERASKLGMFSFPFFTLLGKTKQSGIEWNELGYSIFFLEIQIASNKVLFSNIRKHLDKVASDFESTIGGERENVWICRCSGKFPGLHLRLGKNFVSPRGVRRLRSSFLGFKNVHVASLKRSFKPWTLCVISFRLDSSHTFPEGR